MITVSDSDGAAVDSGDDVGHVMLIAIRDRAVKRPVSRTCNVLVAEFREHSTDCNAKELLRFEVRRRYHG